MILTDRACELLPLDSAEVRVQAESQLDNVVVSRDVPLKCKQLSIDRTASDRVAESVQDLRVVLRERGLQVTLHVAPPEVATGGALAIPQPGGPRELDLRARKPESRR